MSLSAYIIVALYSMIFSIRRLNRPGVGVGIRNLFQKKHSYYVFLFIIVWTIQLSANYCHLFNPEIKNPANTDSSQPNYKLIDEISSFAMFSTGILLAIVRLFEPFFLFLIKQFIYMCFGVLLDEEEEGVYTETLSTFLASSLNVELVHIILKGIKRFSSVKIEQENDAEGIKLRIQRLNRIKIKNPEMWDKAKYEDFIAN